MILKGSFIFDESVDSDHVIDAIHDQGFGVDVEDLTYDDYWGRVQESPAIFEVDVPEEDAEEFRKAMDLFPNKFVPELA
jgi:hypothetical protein